MEEFTETPNKRASHQELLAKQSHLLPEVVDEKSGNQGTSKKEKHPEPKKYDLIKNSTILTSGGLWTPIPRGAVIYAPSHLKSKITIQPKSKLVDWVVFFRKNAGWIHLHRVTMAQARGTESLTPETIKAYQSMGKIVIATYQNSIISVMPEAFTLQKTEQKNK